MAIGIGIKAKGCLSLEFHLLRKRDYRINFYSRFSGGLSLLLNYVYRGEKVWFVKVTGKKFHQRK